MTHFVSFEPQNMGRDVVPSACNRMIYIYEFSMNPTCPDKRCQTGAVKHKLRLLREKIARERKL